MLNTGSCLQPFGACKWLEEVQQFDHGHVTIDSRLL